MTDTTVTPAAPAQTELQIIEARVKTVFTKIANGVEIVVEEAVQGLEDVAALVPAASTDIEDAIAFIEGIPVVGQNPDVLAIVSTVDLATKGLDAFAATLTAAQAAGGSVTVTQASQAIVAGVQAVSTAKAAAANLTGSAAVAVANATPGATPAAAS